MEHSNFLNDEHRELLDPRRDIPSVILVFKPHVKKDGSKSTASKEKGKKSATDAVLSTPNEAYGISDADVEIVLNDLSEMGMNGEEVVLLPSKAITQSVADTGATGGGGRSKSSHAKDKREEYGGKE